METSNTMPSPADRADPDPAPDADAADAGDGDDRLTVLTFSLASERYCVRTDAVASVLGLSETAPLEDADDPWNAGTVTVRGERVRVVDLPRVFAAERTRGTAARIDDPMLLVIDETDETDAYYGWLVDGVDVTRTVRLDALESTRADTKHVDGRFVFEDGSAILLDEAAIHG